ncbi:hypothetical protein ACLF3G_03125 [Falsiroseomonas sp. HC035]|uniref:hypothetical protein n=1 Tax=Falsiroseomonas sp. HC035 TaxID=3390999 RepID=UPI003D3103AD
MPNAKMVPALLMASALAAGPVLAQTAVPADPRDRTTPQAERPGPEQRRPDRSGGGPTGNDIVGEREGGGVPRGVVRPPMDIDPGIQGSVPVPAPNTTPVIPPPGTPGGEPGVVPR